MSGAYNLGKVQRIIANSVKHQVLEFVDGTEEVLAQSSHCSWSNERYQLRIMEKKTSFASHAQRHRLLFFSRRTGAAWYPVNSSCGHLFAR